MSARQAARRSANSGVRACSGWSRPPTPTPWIVQTPFLSRSTVAPMARIAAAAKKEGALTLYTSITAKDLPPLVQPFEAKYGIKVNVVRTTAQVAYQRLTQDITDYPRKGKRLYRHSGARSLVELAAIKAG